MKFKIILILNLFLTNYLVSQSIATKGAEYCTYDERAKSWKDCSVDSVSNTLFFINANKTIINHSTPEHTSIYYVQTKEFLINDKQEKVWSYKVISDTGNTYNVCFNFIDKTIKCAYWQDGKLEGVMYLIESTY